MELSKWYMLHFPSKLGVYNYLVLTKFDCILQKGMCNLWLDRKLLFDSHLRDRKSLICPERFLKICICKWFNKCNCIELKNLLREHQWSMHICIGSFKSKRIDSWARSGSIGGQKDVLNVPHERGTWKSYHCWQQDRKSYQIPKTYWELFSGETKQDVSLLLKQWKIRNGWWIWSV